MAAPFKNVLIVGASGSIGSVIVKALLDEPSLTVTALQRASSKSALPAGLKAVTIDDAYPYEALVAAFAGQDVVVNTMTTTAVAEQERFVDAAVAAKVRRYVPSEFGINNENARAQGLTRVFATKAAVQAYLRARADKGEIEWTAFSPGLWLRWFIDHQFLGFRVADGRLVRYGSGTAPFSVTTEENTALAVARALTTHAAETRNRNVFLQDFKTTQLEVHDAIEKTLGRELAHEPLDLEAYARELQDKDAKGDKHASLSLIQCAFALDGYGASFEEEGSEILNEKLGLPKRDLEGVVRESLEMLGFVKP